jgi:hypothetical protein
MEVLLDYIDEKYILEIIRDYFYGTPKYNYNLVIKNLQENKCGTDCLFHFNDPNALPPLLNNIFKYCKKCSLDYISKSDHEYCVGCACFYNKKEFKYHHSICP